MECYCDTDAICTMDIHGPIETRGEIRWWDGMSQWLLVVYPKLPRISTTQPTSYGNCRSTAIIELLHEITEIGQMLFSNLPTLARLIISYIKINQMTHMYRSFVTDRTRFSQVFFLYYTTQTEIFATNLCNFIIRYYIQTVLEIGTKVLSLHT